MQETRFDRAIAAIDRRNAEDPNTLVVEGVTRPKELSHSEMVSSWVRRLRPDASEPLLLAARAHHIRRWVIARDEYPRGRVGYLEWRRALQDVHAVELRTILEAEGYPEATISRAVDIIRKHGVTRDPEVQTFEDALTMVFLETQYEDTLATVGPESMAGILAKTLRKMSPGGQQLARDWLARRELKQTGD